MTRAEVLEEVLADLEPEVSLLEPRHFFDAFIIGIGEHGAAHFVIYDKDAMVEAMVAAELEGDHEHDDDYDPGEAMLEHYDFNMNQGGPGYPVFLTKLADAD